MIRDIELLDIHDDLSELLEKIPPTDQASGFIPKLLTSCMTFARAIDRLEQRDSLHVQELRDDIRSLHANIVALQGINRT